MKQTIKALLPSFLYNFLFKLKNNKYLIEIQLADHCNLNCAGCSHFSPVAEESFLNVEEYEKDIETLAKIIQNHVMKIHLMGGEPLLHSRITEIISITRKNFPNVLIKVVTNGILLDKMGADFWKACNANNIVVSITEYPIKLNTEKINALAAEYGVKVENFKSGKVFVFDKIEYDINGGQDINKSFRKCGQKYCRHFYQGKLFMCPPPAYIHHINKKFGLNFEVTPGDYLEISKIKDIKTIRDYFSKPLPFCKYCRFDGAPNVAWAVSKKESCEWGINT